MDKPSQLTLQRDQYNMMRKCRLKSMTDKDSRCDELLKTATSGKYTLR